MGPYLKGCLHLTIEHWRDDRDNEGWPDQEAIKLKRRCSDKEILFFFEDHLNMMAIIIWLKIAITMMGPILTKSLKRKGRQQSTIMKLATLLLVPCPKISVTKPYLLATLSRCYRRRWCMKP
jgi:hypothetical protein